MNSPSPLEVSDQLAYIFFQNKMFNLAEVQSEISLNLDPLNPFLHFNAAKSCYYNSNYEKAIEHINICILLKPDWEDSKRELALYLPWVGKYDEALNMLKSFPQDARTKFNLGWYRLNEGDIYEGFKLLENGRLINCWGSKKELPIPKWNGVIEPGKSLLILNEGGVGDELIFARFAIKISQIGMKVSVVPNRQLISIFNRMGIETDIEENYSKYDYWTPSMALPYTMRLNHIYPEPYLTASDVFIEKWKERIDKNKLNIGVRWQGGKLYEHDQRRTLPIEYLEKRLSSIDATFYSLQKESDKNCSDMIIDLEDELQTWEDTLAVIHLMDYVVTSCTAVAHASAAMGKPTYVIVPIVPYFTWVNTKWYNTIEVFKQISPYSWEEAIDEAINFLEQNIKIS